MGQEQQVLTVMGFHQFACVQGSLMPVFLHGFSIIILKGLPGGAARIPHQLPQVLPSAGGKQASRNYFNQMSLACLSCETGTILFPWGHPVTQGRR